MGLHWLCAVQEGKKKKVIQQHFISTPCSFIGPLAKAQKSVRLEITVAYNWVLAGSKIIRISFYFFIFY